MPISTTFFVPFSLLICTVLAVGCGGYYTADDAFKDTSSPCGDWQCSRSVIVGNFTFCVRGLQEGETCHNDHDCYHALECLARVCIKTSDSKVAWQGYVAVAVAVVFFGSNFLPVKKIKTGNGVLYQQFMSLGILVVGICVQLGRESSAFYSEAMLGGMMWALGNCLSIAIIRFVGMGLAVTVWGLSNMAVGWASGHFGIWGISKETVQTPWMSYVGVGVGLASIVVFGFVKPEPQEEGSSAASEESLIKFNSRRVNEGSKWYENPESPRSVSSHVPTKIRPIAGFSLAILAGVFFGFTFDPSQSMMDHYSEKSLTTNVKYSPYGLDYVLSCYIGIFFTSTMVTVLFHMFRRYLPGMIHDSADVDVRKMFVPAVLSGVMWGIAAVAWFVANTNLGLVVSFPLICIGPSVVASTWGVLIFHEVRGARNLTVLALAFCTVGVSCFFTVFAKQ